MTDSFGAEIIFSCGHESANGQALAGVLPDAQLVPAGRQLSEAVAAKLRESPRPVCVLPMTLGRNPKLIADSARALRGVVTTGPRSDHPTDRVVLAEPFGTADHLIGWLRAKAVQARHASPGADDRAALLITAPTGDPFEDAELFRIARLVRQYGQHEWMEVSLIGGDPDVGAGIERCRRLGADRVTVAPAWFGSALAEVAPEPGIDDAGPLLTPSAVRGVVAARVATALSRFNQGDNGIHTGMDAEHGHGYAHSHGPGEGEHHHTHGHGHGHAHNHPHAHP